MRLRISSSTTQPANLPTKVAMLVNDESISAKGVVMAASDTDSIATTG